MDIIVRSPAYHYAFEIKYRERAEVQAKSGLAQYSADEQLKLAFLVTKHDADFAVSELPGLATRFLKVPAHILCYLLGQAERLLWK